jgi:hypothetical protein
VRRLAFFDALAQQTRRAKRCFDFDSGCDGLEHRRHVGHSGLQATGGIEADSFDVSCDGHQHQAH